jgi:general secretion pathway protein H
VSRARLSDAGMTLVEMLVVLAIIGVAAGAVTLGIGAATRAPSVESEARRFAMRLQAAADDAMLGDRMVALTVDESGYGFASVAADGTVPVGTPKLDPHRLPGGMTMILDTEPPVVLGAEGSGKPLSAVIENGSQRWLVRYDGLTATAQPAPTG